MISPKTQFEFKRAEPVHGWRDTLDRLRRRTMDTLEEQLATGLLAPAPSLQRMQRPFQTGIAIAAAAVTLGLALAIPISRIGALSSLLPLYAAIVISSWYGGPVVGLLATFFCSVTANRLLGPHEVQYQLGFLQTAIMGTLGSWIALRIEHFQSAERRINVEANKRRQLESQQAGLQASESAANKRANSAEERFAFLGTASALMTASLEYSSALNRLARLAVPYLGDWCTIDVLEEDGTLRRVAAAHADPDLAGNVELLRRYPPEPMSSHPVVRAIRSGQPDISREVSEGEVIAMSRDETHRSVMRRLGMRTYMIVPLVTHGKAVGAAMFVRSSDEWVYDNHTLVIAQDLAHRAALGIENARLFKASQDEIAERKRAEQELMVLHEQRRSEERHAAVLNERNRIAHEIHDTLAQGFTGIAIQLEAAEASLSRAPDHAHSYISRARGLARDSLAEARRSVWALKPQALDDANLAGALKRLIEETTTGTPINVRFYVRGAVRSLPEATESALLRVGQESLANALKYADAKGIDVELSFDQQLASLRITDNGKGFDLTDTSGRRGLGLLGMRERIERLRGTWTISSEPGGGTEVVATVPVHGDEEGMSDDGRDPD